MAARVVPLEEAAGNSNKELLQRTAAPQDDRPTLFIATPAYGCMLTSQYTQCILQTQLALGELGYGICLDLLGNESLITRARNLLTKRFMLSGASHLLFIDADITWSPEAVIRLLQKNEPVVTGVYPKKFIDWTNLERKLQNPSKEPVHMMGLDYNINVTEREIQVQDGFAKVIDAATGFMLIKREAIERLYSRYQHELFVVNDLIGAQENLKDYIAVFDCMIDPDTRRSLSEDFAFSRRWQGVGGSVYADLAMPLGHTGGFHYEGDFAKRLATTTTPVSASPSQEEDHQKFPQDGRKKLLLALLPSTSEQFSLGFVLALTKAVAAFRQADKFCVQVKTFASKNAACDFLWNDEALEAVVLLDGMHGFEPELLLDLANSKSPLEAAVCPDATMNWARLASSETEPVRTKGLVYAVESRALGKPVQDGRVEVDTSPLQICKIDKCVLQRIRDKLPQQCSWQSGKKCLWFHSGTQDDQLLTDDEMFCKWWGAGVTLNVTRSVTRLGNLTFIGTVLARQQLR